VVTTSVKLTPTRNVVLTDHHEKVVAELARSGRFQNASEVLREGLRRVEQHEPREAVRLKALQQAARFGFVDLDAGRYRDDADDELETIIGKLGRQVGERLRDA
jgi:antitoxin ParD1/3/4